MDKKTLSDSEMKFLQTELREWKAKGLIDTQTERVITAQYVEREKLNFLRIILVMGAVILGIGIISFLAGNWRYINDFAKIAIIITITLITNLSAFFVEDKNPKTSRALYYLGIIELGAGILLIRNIFNIVINSADLFLYWAIGTVSIIYLTRDRAISSFFSALTFFYIVNYYGEQQTYPFFGIVFLTANFFIVYKLLYSDVNFMLAAVNAIALFTIAILEVFSEFDSRAAIVFTLLFIVGIILSISGSYSKYGTLIRQIGHGIHGFSGIGLSVSETWQFTEYDLIISTAFAVLYFLYLLYLIKRENLISIVFSGLIVLTLYINLTYEFLPKSLIFIVSGAILLFFGYYFEKKRKVVEKDEKQS